MKRKLSTSLLTIGLLLGALSWPGQPSASYATTSSASAADGYCDWVDNFCADSADGVYDDCRARGGTNKACFQHWTAHFQSCTTGMGCP